MSKAKEICTRDYIAIEMAKAIKPPDDYVGASETEKSYKAWATKCYKMADALIKRGNIE